MREAVIVSAVRTPGGRANKGAYKDVRPEDLGSAAIRGALARVPGLAPADVEDVIMGCAMPEGEQGLNVARVIALNAGLPVTVPGQTVNRFCSSGLQTVANAAERIMAGFADVIVAGGVESMSAVPMSGHTPRPHPRTVFEQPALYTPMGSTAEIVATRYGITREQQDAFALSSHQKALAAIQAGRFADEIVPFGSLTVDEGPRADTTLEGARGHRSVRDQRGLRQPGALLRATARHRPGRKVNVNGGAIALGHPLGCTGAKLTATLLHELKRRDAALRHRGRCASAAAWARPGSSSRSSSRAVRPASTPSTVTRWAAASMVMGPTTSRSAAAASSAGRTRRRIARTRSTSSRGLKGLVM
jgi:acetyl-CoA acetyltransferase